VNLDRKEINVDISERFGIIPEQQEDIEPFMDLTPALVQKRRSQGRIVFDRFIRHRAAVVGMIFMILLTLVCFLGPALTGHNTPNVQHLDAASLDAPLSLRYPLGADDLGRDTFARVMAGGQVSLLVGLASMLMSIIFGIGIGSVAGYYGGLIDNLLMRFTDIILAVPLYLLLFVLSASFSDGTPRSVILIIAIFGWTVTARLVRSEFLAIKEREYVLAARTIGVKDFRMMFRHMLPNALGSIIVSATLLVSGNIVLESVLSYFGFGLKPPDASWGNLVGDGQNLVDVDPKLVWIPAMAIFFTVLSLNLVGDGLRDAFDPYMTER
jgi:peptide/nickel transport system permease protein